VVVREVDDPVGRLRTGAEAVGVVQTAAVHLGPERSDRCRRGVRASEGEDLVSGAPAARGRRLCRSIRMLR
jgi:hypothetical protein